MPSPTNQARAGAATMALKLAGVGLSFLFTRIITQLCGAEGWGLYSICFTAAMLLMNVGRLGTDTAMLRLAAEAAATGRYGRFRSALRGSLSVALPVSLGLAAALWVLSPWLARDVFNSPPLLFYLRIAALWVPGWAALFIVSECLRGLGRVQLSAWLQNVLPYLMAVVCMLPALLGAMPVYSPDAPLVGYLVGLYGALVWAGVALWLAVRQNVGPRARYPGRLIRQAALPLLSTSILVVVLGWTDALILGAYRPPGETGLYTAALRTVNLILLPLQALSSVAAPLVAGLYARGRMREMRLQLRRTSKLVALGTVPAFAVLALASPWVMAFYGPGFVQGWPLLVVLGLGQLVNGLSGPIDVIFQMTGAARIYRNLIALAVVVNLSANVALVPHFGAMGAAVANLAAISTWNVVAVFIIWRRYRIWLWRWW